MQNPALQLDLVSFVKRVLGKYKPDVLVPIEIKGMAIVKYATSVAPEIFEGLTLSPARIHHERVLYYESTDWQNREVLVFDDAVFTGRTMATSKSLIGEYASRVVTTAYWVCSESLGTIRVDESAIRRKKRDILDDYFQYHLWLSKFRLPTINENPTICLRIVPPIRRDQINRLLEMQAFNETRDLGSGLQLVGVHDRLFHFGSNEMSRDYIIKAYYDPTGELYLSIQRFSDEMEDSSDFELTSLDGEWLDFVEKEVPQIVGRLSYLVKALRSRMELKQIDLEGMRRRNQKVWKAARDREFHLRDSINEKLLASLE